MSNMTRKKRISVQSAKAKGRTLQQWACRMISRVTGYEWGSPGTDKPIESRPMGQSGTDVRMESQVRELFPFSVECKWQESWSVGAWIQQAKDNRIEGTDWLLIAKKSRMKPVAIIDGEAFFNLVARAGSERFVDDIKLEVLQFMSQRLSTHNFLKFTEIIEEHPEEWEGPCLCVSCKIHGGSDE